MNEEKTCITCEWSYVDGFFDLMCVNLESDECGGVVYVNGCCERWEGMTE